MIKEILETISTEEQIIALAIIIFALVIRYLIKSGQIKGAVNPNLVLGLSFTLILILLAWKIGNFPSNSSPKKSEWVGRWSITSGCKSLSENDTMIIEIISKDELRGSYSVKFYNQGNVWGKLTGKAEKGIFKGTWEQSNGKGGFEFRINVDKKSFEGTYTRENYKGVCVWNGRKTD